jgi:hypothetical protein
VRKARVAGLIAAGGLLVGMSSFASGISRNPVVVVIDHQMVDVQSGPDVLLDMVLPKCATAEVVSDQKCEEPRMGTPGSGLNCTGAWRVVCGT